MKFTVSVAMIDPVHYCPVAQAAEAAGWDAVAVPDSIFFSEKVSANYPYTPDGNRFWEPSTPFVAPFVAIPAMAAVTSRIRFYTNVIKLAIRSPLLVAKTVSSVAVMSGNRFALGAGLGWQPEEFEWCQTDYKTRGKRANEALEIIQLLVNGKREPVAYDGEHYQFESLRLSPVPTEPVPIYIGGHSNPGLRRAAHYDGWTSAMTTEAEIRGLIEKLKSLRIKYFRDHLPFEIQAVCLDVFDPDGFKRLEDAGVTDVITQPWWMYGASLNATLQQKQDALHRFADEVIRVVNQ